MMSIFTKLFCHVVRMGDRIMPYDPDTVAGLPGVYPEDAAFIRDAMLKAKWEKPPGPADAAADTIRALRAEVRQLRAEVALLERRLKHERR
jgi:hypothetical protein